MKYLFLGLFALATLSGFAQDLSWKQHEKLGDELMAQGQYANAADNYELAWEQRPSKPSLLAKAADAYRQFRHYQKAADCYEPLLGNKNFPLTAWHYGRCLKQTGQYQTARVHLQKLSRYLRRQSPSNPPPPRSGGAAGLRTGSGMVEAKIQRQPPSPDRAQYQSRRFCPPPHRR